MTRTLNKRTSSSLAPKTTAAIPAPPCDMRRRTTERDRAELQKQNRQFEEQIPAILDHWFLSVFVRSRKCPCWNLGLISDVRQFSLRTSENCTGRLPFHPCSNLNRFELHRSTATNARRPCLSESAFCSCFRTRRSSTTSVRVARVRSGSAR